MPTFSLDKKVQEKARRGELKRLLPPGYVYDAVDKVVQDSAAPMGRNFYRLSG